MMKINENLFKLEYYEDFRVFLRKISIFDKSGIPMIYFYATGEIVYNPTTVAIYALANLQLYLLGDKNALDRFKLACTWLMSNGLKTKLGFILPLNFDHPIYGLKRGWISAMTQGLAISCFIRQYILNGNDLLLKLAQEAARPMIEEIKNGGVAYYDENGDIWFEEIPTSPPPHILNGFIYGIVGLYDLYCHLKNDYIEDFIIKSINTLKKNIHRYDLGYWSKYQLNPHLPASLNYHKLHIRQLVFLYKISDEVIFKDYAAKFVSYMKYRSNYLLAQYIEYFQYLRVLVRTMRLHSIDYAFSRIIKHFATSILQ